MEYAADAISDIRSRMREIRKEENRADTDWITATTSDLDLIAASYDLVRISYETDSTLRDRIGAAIQRKIGSNAIS